MFGLKLFKRTQSPVTRHVSPPVAPAAQGWASPTPRASGPPPPPPPPEAFLSAQAPAIPLSAMPAPVPVARPVAEMRAPDPAIADPSAEAAPATARVRFFYSDGTVSEPDAQETERLGYLATNLLEASRDDLP